ncbi:MAG: VOC family protein [Oscillospiraceae bacterium]|nr:VOC family protein [Oscillospiraceae bacterium]
MEIHHIGYLVKDISAAIEKFLQLGYHIHEDTITDNTRGIDVCFLANGGYIVELVSPTGAQSPMAPMLKKIGNSPYHICYKTTDIEADAALLRKQGFVPTQPIAPGGQTDRPVRVAFFFNRHIGLIELFEG